MKEEIYDACAVREVREELGLVLPGCPQRLFKLEACAETGQEHVWVYRGRAEGPFALNPEEIEEGSWFAAGQITRWTRRRPADFSRAFLLIWPRFLGWLDGLQ